MDIALRDTLLSQFTLWTLFTMSKLSKLLYTVLKTVACIPIYICREGKNDIGIG